MYVCVCVCVCTSVFIFKIIGLIMYDRTCLPGIKVLCLFGLSRIIE